MPDRPPSSDPTSAAGSPPPPCTADYNTAASTAALTSPPTSIAGAGVKPRSRFTVLRPHAQGGLGRVSVARDEKLQRQVAVKEIRPDRLGIPSLEHRFLIEAEITGQLEHPGIVPVYDLDADGSGRPYYVMRFVEGRTLADAIRAFHGAGADFRSLALHDLLQRFVSVCQTVAYAHSKGVIHRDLKPANVMLGPYGETLVLDWGLAKRLGDVERPASLPPPPPGPSTSTASAGVTQPGQVLGTPAYMAPEQAAGKLDLVGPAADIYALGAMLYYLLNGQAPYAGQSADAVVALVRQGAPPVPTCAAVPRALSAICRKAMGRDAAERYPTALELARDLERWLADQPVQAYREPIHVRLGRWVRRHKPLVTGVATAAFLLFVVLIVWRFASYHRRELARQQVSDRLAQAAKETAAGHFDQAISTLGEAQLLGADQPTLAALVEEAEKQKRDLEKHREFWQRVRADEARSVDVRGEDVRKTELERKMSAIAVYDPVANPTWAEALADTSLGAERIAAVKSKMARLLIESAVLMLMINREGRAEELRQGLVMVQRAEALHGPSESTCLLRVLHHSRLGDDAAARAAGAERKTVKARDAFDLYMLGQFALGGGKPDYPRAMDHFRNALSLEPDHLHAHYGMFNCYFRLGKLSEAAESLTVCLALRPADARYHYLRGTIYFRQDDYERAFRDFTAAIERDATFADPHYFRGRVHFIAGKYAEADKDLSRSLELDPKYPSPDQWRAIARAKLNRYRDAVTDAETALAARGGDAEVSYQAGRAYAQAARAALADGAEPDRVRIAESYAARAVALLRQAFHQGHNILPSLHGSPDLAPLRGREDFKKLTAEVEGK